MVAAMAGFAVEDMFLKAAAQTVPPAVVMAVFGAGGAAVFAVLALASGERLFPPAARAPAVWIRAVFEVTGRLFYTLAIAFTPLSSTSAILQATPIVVVAGAALVFGERVGWRRWTAIGVGLAGVMVILRPGAESFSALSLLAVAGMLGFAGRDLATRAAPRGLGTFTLGVYGFLAIVVAAAIYAVVSGDRLSLPGSRAGGALAGAILFGVAGYSALTLAMRTGEVSAVTPFRYSRLLFGVFFGVAVFGETLTLPMLTGSAIIVASGLYILARGGRPVAVPRT
jgi:drug/metabolite transporter (DMT)-like permease